MREQQLVELVSPDGSPAGTATVADAHAAPGLLHRAFSVLLIDHEGRTLLQRRSATKTRFPMRWANSCCGHPMPGESVESAARRRLTEELGVSGMPLRDIGVYSYAASDPGTGRVEREYDHVLVALVPGSLAVSPDPDEVMATRWVSLSRLRDEMVSSSSSEYAPWLEGVLTVAVRSTVSFDLS